MSYIIPGLRVGRLTVVEQDGVSASRNKMWKCLCDCGNYKRILGSSLSNGHTKSCGCFRSDTTRANKTIHGAAKRKSHTREYRIWSGILSRCLNPKAPGYEYYGGRGINVCLSWQSSFQTFYNDMGQCPAGLSIDRKNNELGYGPENCQWATKIQQANNRRKRRWKKKP